MLNTHDHDRSCAGLTYVYPVVSRRAAGVSLGINLNTNHACNWQCIYCQVPDLKRGGPLPVDLQVLERELRDMLAEIMQGDFMARHVPEDMRRLNDVALSGNGEPTSAPEFADVVAAIGRVLADAGLLRRIKLVLITNGSLLGKSYVQAGLRAMAAMGGEVWFKFDRATRAGMHLVNATDAGPERHYQRLKIAAKLCPTWLQTCLFAIDGAPPPQEEVTAWLDMLARSVEEAVPLRGVLLYGLARPSLQAEASRLSTLPESWLYALAAKVEALGITAKVSP